MSKFEYAGVTKKQDPNNPGQYLWIAVPPFVPSDPNPIIVLNALGQKGWEVVGFGDLGGGVETEILLKKVV